MSFLSHIHTQKNCFAFASFQKESFQKEWAKEKDKRQYKQQHRQYTKDKNENIFCLFPQVRLCLYLIHFFDIPLAIASLSPGYEKCQQALQHFQLEHLFYTKEIIGNMRTKDTHLRNILESKPKLEKWRKINDNNNCIHIIGKYDDDEEDAVAIDEGNNQKKKKRKKEKELELKHFEGNEILFFDDEIRNIQNAQVTYGIVGVHVPKIRNKQQSLETNYKSGLTLRHLLNGLQLFKRQLHSSNAMTRWLNKKNDI